MCTYIGCNCPLPAGVHAVTWDTYTERWYTESWGRQAAFSGQEPWPRIGGADSHPGCFTLSCKPPQDILEFLARRSQQDNIICEKQRWVPVAPGLDTLWHVAVPRNSVKFKNNEQNQWQRPTGVQRALRTGLTYCRQCEPSSCSGHTGTIQPLAEGLRP